MVRDLCDFTWEKTKALGEEIEKEFREEIALRWGKEFLEDYEEYKKKYPEIITLKYNANVISQIISWFTLLRLHWKCSLEEANEILGDALTISENLDESIDQAFGEDLKFEASDHLFVDEVIKRVRGKKRGFKVYRRKPSKKRKVVPKEKIQEMRREGKSLRQISESLGIPKSTIHDSLDKT